MSNGTIDRKDLVVGTAIAIVMAGTFVYLGGKPLLVTFVPGMIVAWGIFLWLYRSKTRLPAGASIYPIYFAAVAWQFVHFFEEYLTGFRIEFPALYGAAPLGDDLFVGINMFSYFVFTVGFILALEKQLRFLLVPVLFFTIYGVLGNAVAHVWWAILAKGYFPGLFTALVYWLIGPVLLKQFVGSYHNVVAVIVVFAILLVASLTFTMPVV